MRHTSGALLIFVATLVSVDTSSATDLPVAPAAPPPAAPPLDWSAFYVGIEGGGGFGNSTKSFSSGRSTSGFNVEGAIAGGAIGYIKQWGDIAAGLEADFSWSGVRGGANCPGRGFTCQTNTSWLATVRPRIGYELGDFMPYVTGGLAVGSVNVKSFLISTGAGNGVDFTKTTLGWTAGAGIEMSIYAHWSIKAEYLFVQMNNTNGPSDNPPVTSTTFFKENVVRGGLNYSFY